MGKVLSASLYDYRVRLVCCDTTDLVQEITAAHDLSPQSAVVLGRVCTASVLLGSWISENEKVAVVFKGDGPAGEVAAESDFNLNIRGYIQNSKLEIKRNALEKADVASSIGKGFVYVVRDLGLKTPVTSSIKIVSGEVAQDIAYYMNKSEQVPCAVNIGVLVNSQGIAGAGGMMIQILDQHLQDSIISEIEEIVYKMKNISSYIAEKNSLEKILKLFPKAQNIKESSCRFFCGCTKEKSVQALSAFGISELRDMQKQESTEIKCKWCSKKYYAAADDIEKIISEKQVSENKNTEA
ncbi:MAG TPA: Hsp33 family molecular chaperone HslO [Petrotogaceae bacterium]|nr:Hsp33 family molecular chaperone HslO [Petrotogaceae bacterium]HQO12393.1 Hsp33 family molecular chaperone HslO [Petrotogaceae bacterium]HQP58748.1 Hsp33 family molecular chaperone HslO [Petrotogaceae bacterium]